MSGPPEPGAEFRLIPLGGFPQRAGVKIPTDSGGRARMLWMLHPRRFHPMGWALGIAFGFALSLVAQEPKKPTPPPAQPPAGPAWQSLFDGKTLTGWKVTDFAGRGDVKVDSGRLLLETGVMTGVTWSNDLPRMDYEISLEAMRVDGSDFFCGLTFPVGKDPCSFIVGGWGGGVVGL